MKRCSILLIIGLPLWLSWQIIFLQCGTPEFNPWVGKTPWRRERLPTPVFWPGEFYILFHGVKRSRTWLSDLLLEKYKSKIWWGTTSYRSEQPSSKILQTKIAGESVEKREPSYTVGGTVNWCSHYRKQHRSSLKKLKIELSKNHNPTPGYVSEQNYNWKWYIHPRVHSSTTLNSQYMEAA